MISLALPTYHFDPDFSPPQDEGSDSRRSIELLGKLLRKKEKLQVAKKLCLIMAISWDKT